MTHEGVDGGERIALLRWKNKESVIEIFGRGARDVAADAVGSAKLEGMMLHGGAHASFLTRAPSTRRSFLDLEITGRLAENVVVLAFDGGEDLKAATREQSDIEGEVLGDFVFKWEVRAGTNRERVRTSKNFMRARNAGVARRCAMSCFGDAEATEVFKRKIDSFLAVVEGYVLPEIGELERGAGVVGKLLALGIAVSAKVEDEVSDGIGGVATVGEEVVERFVSSDGLVLTERREEVGELVLRNAELTNGVGERDEDGMARRSQFTGGDGEGARPTLSKLA